MRVVFDTNAVVSALLFRGSLSWLVGHWGNGEVAPLVCRETHKPGQSDREPQQQPDVFLNALGQLTGMTINITA